MLTVTAPGVDQNYTVNTFSNNTVCDGNTINTEFNTGCVTSLESQRSRAAPERASVCSLCGPCLARLREVLLFMGTVVTAVVGIRLQYQNSLK